MAVTEAGNVLVQRATERLHTAGLGFSNESIWTYDRARGRPRILTKYASLPAPEREGKALAHLLARAPIGYVPGDWLAGDMGLQFLDAGERQAVEREAKGVPAVAAPSPFDESAMAMKDRFGCECRYTPAHTLIDHERVLAEGLGGAIRRIKASASDAADPEAIPLYRGMIAALEGVIAWARRYSDILDAAAPESSDPESVSHLAAICRRVPEHPAETFHEAVQSICFLRMATALSEYSGASISLGRLDQILYPYYEKECLTASDRERLGAILVDLWLKLNRFGDAAATVNIGGLDESGRDQFNDLSALIVDVCRALPLPAPLLAVRIHDKTTEAQFASLVAPELITRGQPTFYGEEACRAAMRKRGASEEEAVRFSVNSCMGLVVPGAEFADMWAAKVPAPLALELALHGGAPYDEPIPLSFATPPRKAYGSIDELFRQWAAYLDELVCFCARSHEESIKKRNDEHPNPFLSAVLGDCIERGCGHTGGGVRHYTASFDAFGLVNVADALTAIKKLVFETGRYSLAEMVAAASADYEGREDLRKAILDCPAYGQGHGEADAMASRVATAYADAVRRHDTPTRRCQPSFHTLNLHIAIGGRFGASLDGRRAGQPWAKNMGPALHRGRPDPTGLVLSASAIDQGAFSGGQALDLHVDPLELATASGQKAFRHLLATYFHRGGLEIQVNGVDAATLEDAMENPGEHQDLQVRIAGYSARFTELTKSVQEEMLDRFRLGL